MEKLQKFRENIWWQLGLLLVIAVVCGSLIGLVWWVSGLNRPQNSGYAGIYSANCTYEVDDTFAGETKTVASAEEITVKSTEKVVASDGAVLVRVQATASNKVQLDMYVVVKESAAEYIYFVSTNKTYLTEWGYKVKNNKLNVAELTKISRATLTYDALRGAISLAKNA